MERQHILSPEIAQYQKEKKAQIYGAFKKATEPGKVALAIVKDEFDQQYPVDKYEYYSLEAVNNFRQDILKADDIEDKDGAFKKATEDLVPFIVHHDGNKALIFTRKKQKGE